MPEKEITPGASPVIQLAVVRGRLCLRGKPVDSKSAKEGLKSFVEWLKAKEMPVVLFAHNAKSFDCKRLIFSLQKCDLLNSFQSCVVGFVDTLILFKSVMQQREKYSQENLVSDLLGISYSAHDSLEDARALQRLLSFKEVLEGYYQIQLHFKLCHQQYKVLFKQGCQHTYIAYSPLLFPKLFLRAWGTKLQVLGSRWAI